MRLLTIKRLLSFAMLWMSAAEIASATGARRLADLNPGAVGSYPSNFTAFGGVLYFSAYTLETGTELWRYNGTSVSLAANINPTADDIGFGVKEGNDSIPDWLTEFGGQLYFSAFHPGSGGELWRYDGIQAVRVSDINPDQNPNSTNTFIQNSAWPNQLTILNNSLYFSATSSTRPEDYELWSYNASGAQRVANLHPEIGTNHSSYPTGLTTFSGALYFMADDGTHGWELWRHDGAETRLFDLNPGGSDSSSYPKEFTAFNNELYFSAFTDAAGFELWKTDGAAATLAADVQAGPESSYPAELAVYNGALYFQAFHADTGYELRKFAAGQVSLAADINPAGDSYPKSLTVLGDLLVFTADDGANGWELWKYDGASASMVTNLNPAGDSFPAEFTVLNGELYFVATTPETGYEVWKFDGTSITLAADINAGPGDSFPRNLAAINGAIYFSAAEDGTSNWEPWVLEASVPTNQPPSVALTSPTEGATYLTTENISFAASATDDSGVARVEFYANATLVGTDEAAPFALSATLPAGTHAVTAKAFDTASAEGTSASVTITVREPTVNQPPTISLTSPASGAAFLTTDTINLSAEATDDSGVTRVEFYVNDGLIATDNAAPYAASVNLAAGGYTITARAFDAHEAGGTSAPVTITVTEPAGNLPPTITLTSDQAGQTLIAPATVTLRASASDADGIAEVQFFNGGSALGADTTPPYEASIPNLAPGLYSFTAVARDTTGLTATSATIEVRVAARPNVSIARTGASIVLTATVTSGIPHAIQASADLVNWNTIQTVTPSDGTITFTDNASEARRFYRIIAE